MKKVLFLLAALPLLLLNSCSSDDDDSYENVLDGTTWKRHVEESIDTYEMDESFSFKEKKGTYEIVQKEDGKVIFEEEIDFSYKFTKANEIQITVFNKKSTALIEGRKMMFLTGYEDETPIFTKQ